MPVKIFHNRYLFVKIDDTKDTYIDIYSEIQNVFVSLYGYISLGLSRLKLVQYISDKKILILRIDSKYHDHLVTSLIYLSIIKDVKIDYIGSSSTLRQGKRKYGI